MCKVLNKHAVGSHADAVYIGRGSKWGFARGAHRVVARGCRMIVTGRRQQADRGRVEAEDPSVTSVPRA